MGVTRLLGKLHNISACLSLLFIFAACADEGTPQRPPGQTDQGPDLTTSDMGSSDMQADQAPDMKDMATPGACANDPCREPNRSVCTEDANGQTQCACDAGYQDNGMGQCVIADPCMPNPCTEANRSVCAADANGQRAICSCDAGFVDNNGACVPQDLCEPNPCTEPNRSDCRVGANNTIICACDDGFSDVNGQCMANPVCGPNACVEPNRSSCQEVNGQAVCSCDVGYQDNGMGQCVPQDPCMPNPCTEANRSLCNVGANNTVSCSCDAGFVDNGGACVPQDPCLNNPCMMPNRSVCSNNAGQAVCSCDVGYQDDGMGQCKDLDPCDPNPCVAPNQTTCSVDAMTNAAICACDTGYQDDGMGGCAPIPPPTCNNQHATGDSYEPNECPSLATLITPGARQQHTIDPAGDLDYFRFDVQAGEIMQFAELSARDVVVTLYDTDGATVLASSDSPEWLRREFATAGTYYARVRHYSSSGTGAHEVELTSLGFDDHGDDIMSATPFPVGQSIAGEIETGNDRDYFSFTAQAGHIYQIEETTPRDVVLYLLDAQGNFIASTDSPEWLRRELNVGGTYYIYVRHYSSSSIGAYSLTLTDLGLDDHGDDIMSATPFPVGQSIAGEIETGNDRDYFSFTAQAGHIYQIEETTPRDVVLYLLDAQGNFIASTDSPEWLRRELNVGGTYYIYVRHYSSSSIGAYSLTLTDLGLDDHGDDIMSATPFPVGQTINAELETAGDRDYFSFTAQAGHIYQIEETTPRDVILYLLDTQGNILTSADSPERLLRELDAGGTYYVYVRHYSSSSIGAYALTLTDLGLDDHGDNSPTATAVPLSGSTQTIMGQVETAGDRDYFSVTVAAGQSVDFYETTSANVTLTLYDTDGTTVIQSITNPERISRRFDVAGTYFLALRYESSSNYGSYTLEITDEGQDDHGNGPTQTTPTLTDGTPITGRVQFSGDQDWFSFTTGAGQVYSIKIEGFAQARATLYDSDGVTQLDTRTNGTMFPQLAAAKTYYVRVDSTSASAINDYTLTIND